MWILLLCLGILILVLTRKSKKFYSLNDYPQMYDFHNNFAQIQEECKRCMNLPINDLKRPTDVWSNTNQTKTLQFLANCKDLTGWMYAWQPGSDSSDKWLNFPLVAVGYHFENNKKHCPILSKIIEKHKNKINICGFSWFKPDTQLAEHTDNTGIKYGSLSYHLGLIVPEKCNLIVAGEEVHQAVGKSIIFDSTYLHSANNNSKQDRIILYIDFKI